jgi:hypothetical protein
VNERVVECPVHIDVGAEIARPLRLAGAYRPNEDHGFVVLAVRLSAEVLLDPLEPRRLGAGEERVPPVQRVSRTELLGETAVFGLQTTRCRRSVEVRPPELVYLLFAVFEMYGAW